MKIFIKARVGARREKIEKTDHSHFSVWVREKPEKGRANQAIINLLADYFKVSKSKVRIISGFGSRNKLFEIIGK